MQQSIFQQVNPTEQHLRSGGPRSGMLSPGHGTGSKTPACNDECYLQEESLLKMMLSVLANVVGGAIFLTAMFNLPVILAVIWDI